MYSEDVKNLGLTESNLNKLNTLGIRLIWDLILHVPLRYEDETHLTPIRDAPLNKNVLVEGTVLAQEIQFKPRRQLVVQIEDGSATLVLRFIHFYPSQQKQMAAQEHQQELQQRISVMQAAASESLQEWKTVSTQVYVEGSAKEEAEAGAAGPQLVGGKLYQPGGSGGAAGDGGGAAQEAIIKTGDVLFAVLDTSVNSDEPGPILATIVSGKLKGSKLIGSFTLPPNADKMVISFNTMSVPGAAKTTSINAYAIDPNTARTALSSRTNHHYLMRYGSLFASTFLQGFGNAFQSAGTTITIGGTGGVQTTTVQSGIGRSILENAVIGLATLGKSWAQVAQQQFNRPTTVEVCSGTGMGILFTQDVTSL